MTYQMLFVAGFYDIEQLTGIISTPLKMRYSPRAGGTECQIQVKLRGTKDSLLNIIHEYPQYKI